MGKANTAEVIELPLNLTPIRDSVKELETLYKRKMHHSVAYAEACEAIGMKSKIEPSVIKAYIKARVEEKLQAEQKKAEQLQLLFTEVG